MYDVVIGRGCPHACSYCCNSLFRKLYKGKGRYVRYRSVDDAIEELEYAKEQFPYARVINIQDDGFAAAPEAYLREFSEKYRAAIGLPLRTRVVATSMNEDKMACLSRANVMSAIVGLQANDRVNEKVFNRRIPSSDFLRTARLIKKYGLVGEYQIIGRNPYSTEEDMVELCEILAEVSKPYRLQIFDLGIFPHTGLWDKALSDGVEVNELDGYQYTYGSYPERFPFLRSLQEVTPHTPRWLVLLLLRNRGALWSRCLLKTYRVLFFDNLLRLKNVVIRSSFLVVVIRKILTLRAGPKFAS
jgi:radical SAM superfamily enzyme YgiQ (UPF0313 family)